MNRRSLAFFISVAVLFSFLFGYQFGRIRDDEMPQNEKTETEKKPETKDPADLKIFWDVWNRLQEKYVDSSALVAKNMVHGAIRGLVSSLEDPYTVYMTPEETVEFQNSLDGTLEGIGAELTVKDKQLTIVSVIKSSPAERAGLKAEDVILEINDESAADLTIYNAITKIRGKRGTTVKLLLFRKENGKPFEVDIVRDKIVLDSVILEEKGDGIFYIGVHQFTDRTSEEFSAMVKEILLKNPRGIVLDLRGNGGGYLEVAVSILSEFIGGKKVAVKIQRREQKENDEILLGNSPSLRDVPLAVLVNRASASASEIVAGAVQDHKRGIVIGEVTFGKGSVQEVQALPDKSSLRVTIAKWLTPDSRSIDEVGIKPDIEIVLTEEDLKKGKDSQMERALEYLKKMK